MLKDTPPALPSTKDAQIYGQACEARSHRPAEGEARHARHQQEESGRGEVGAWQLERRGVGDEVGEESGAERVAQRATQLRQRAQTAQQRTALARPALLGDDGDECGDARAAYSRCEDG